MGEPDARFDYDIYQQIYCLNAAANCVGMRQGTQAQLLNWMDQALNKLLPLLSGEWRVTWGPQVYKTEPTSSEDGPDNAWFAAESASQKICLVAIAGTATDSPEAWERQNKDVSNLVDFNKWVKSWVEGKEIDVPTDPFVKDGPPFASRGSCQGVANLLNNASTRAASGKYLYQYLKTVDKGYNVVFTGHSLGGALSPTLALGLVQSGIADLQASNVWVYPSAGATPGDENFSKLFKETFPPEQKNDYTARNVDFFNTRDIVPMAWAISTPPDRNMDNILGKIFTGDILGIFLRGYVNRMKDRPIQSGAAYFPIPGVAFDGTPFRAPRTWWEFRAVMRAQHTTEYWAVIKIQPFVAEIFRALDEVGAVLKDYNVPDHALDTPL